MDGMSLSKACRCEAEPRRHHLGGGRCRCDRGRSLGLEVQEGSASTPWHKLPPHCKLAVQHLCTKPDRLQPEGQALLRPAALRLSTSGLSTSNLLDLQAPAGFVSLAQQCLHL